MTLRIVASASFLALSPLLGGVAQAEGLSLGLSVPSASGQSSTDLNVSWSDARPVDHDRALGNPFCAKFATIIYTTASHPNGNRFGILNEQTGGVGVRCYIDEAGHFYVIVATLKNSQFGDTFAFGPGVKHRLLELSSAVGTVSLDVGAEVPYVHYAYGPYLGQYLRARGRAINSPLPMYWIGVNWKIGGAEVGMMQSYLPKDAAHLRATVIGGSPNQLPPIGQTPLLNGSGLGRDNHNGPSVFLRYQFKDFLGM